MISNQYWQVGLSTHTGPVKQRNEDNYFLRMHEENGRADFAIAAIADGMGGYDRGDAASRTAVHMLEDWWEKRLVKILKKPQPLRKLLDELNTLLQKINKELLRFEKKAGTTFSILILYKGDFAVCHVGDSRIYQIKGGSVGFQNYFRARQESDMDRILRHQSTEALESECEILQLTEDHSWVEQQVKKGILTKEEARNHQKRNVLTQCLGIKEDVASWEQMGSYQSSDLFLLCSDGFYSMFSNEEITETLSGLEKEYTDLQTMADYLVKLANYSGTRDNITVLLIRNVFEKGETGPVPLKTAIMTFFQSKLGGSLNGKT